jgi:hypothetical protein
MNVQRNRPPSPSPIPITRKVTSFTNKFNRLYQQYYVRQKFDASLFNEVSNTRVSIDVFDKITLGKRYQGRIALIDGKIRFDEIPNRPHGEVISYVTMLVNASIGAILPGAPLIPYADNGM